MNNEQWTPGPWVATRNAAYWVINPANRRDEDPGFAGDPFTVGDACSSAPGYPDGGLQEANARLMASAPDLYDALQTMLDEAAHLAGFSPHTEQKVLSAMAKARGETQ